MQRIQKYQMVCERVQGYSVQSKRVREPSVVWQALLAMGIDKLLTEHFYVLCLATNGDIVGIHDISTGTVNSSVVHPREVFTAVINTPRTASFIVAHNHPSGDIKPSAEDIAVTKRLKECGELLGIKLLDHVIVTEHDYYSFKDSTIIF